MIVRKAELSIAKRLAAVAGEDAQEGRLPCPIGADDAIAVTGGELQIRMLKQDGTRKLHT